MTNDSKTLRVPRSGVLKDESDEDADGGTSASMPAAGLLSVALTGCILRNDMPVSHMPHSVCIS